MYEIPPPPFPGMSYRIHKTIFFMVYIETEKKSIAR